LKVVGLPLKILAPNERRRSYRTDARKLFIIYMIYDRVVTFVILELVITVNIYIR